MVWLVTIASLFTLFASSEILFSLFVFSTPMQADFGWNDVTWVIIISLVLAGLLFISYRRLANKLGIRLVVILGVLLLGVGCVLMSQIVSFWQLIVFWGVIIGIGFGSGIASVVYSLQAWLPNRKGLKIGIICAGLGIGILAIPFINIQLITNYDWRTTYIVIGFATLRSLIPAISILVIAQFLKRKKAA